MRPLARRSLGRTHSEEALSHWIENKKFAILIGDNDGVAHVGQNGLEDFVGTGELFCGAFSLYDQIQVCGDWHNHLNQLFVLPPRFAHEKFDHRDDLIAR